MRTLSLLLLSIPGWVGAQEKKTAAPPALMPTIVFLQSVDREKRTATYFEVRVRTMPVTATEMVIENGVAKMVTVTRNVVINEVVVNSINLRESRIFNAKGEVLNLEVALKRLQAGEAVTLSPDHNMIHPVYARLLREDAIVLTRNPTIAGAK